MALLPIENKKVYKQLRNGFDVKLRLIPPRLVSESWRGLQELSIYQILHQAEGHLAESKIMERECNYQMNTTLNAIKSPN